MQKRGISTVVATVLIILITVAAVTILWTFILSMLRNNFSTSMVSDLSISTLEGYTAIDKESGRLCVQVKRENDNAKITGVQFIFLSSGNPVQFIGTPAPEINTKKEYCFFISNKDISNVKIAPVFEKGQSQEYGAITSSLEDIPKGDLSNYNAQYINLFGESGEGCNPGSYSCNGDSLMICDSSGNLEISASCSGQTPVCNAIQRRCECNSASCGSGESCASGVCEVNQILNPITSNPSLVSYWNFSSGAIDTAGRNNGVLLGGASIITDSEKGAVLNLDGTGYVSVPDSDSLDLTTLTVAAWIRESETSQMYTRILEKGGAYDIEIGGGNLNFILFNSGKYRYTPHEYPGGWTFVAGTFNSSNNTQFIHIKPLGEEEWQQWASSSSVFFGNDAPTNMLPAITSNNLTIGMYYLGGHFFKGQIDDVMIFRSPLTQQQLEEIYSFTKPSHV
jgi:hypothetical protein